MSIFLIIDVALPEGSVVLANEKNIIDECINNEPMQHASWLHSSIEKILLKNKILVNEIDAVAVTNGPGSYTGIRIGLSAAKGLCFALNIPLIIINNLEAIAKANKKLGIKYYFPMIDARRNEVFYTSFDTNFSVLEAPKAKILEKNSFENIAINGEILFCGTAAKKCQNITNIDDKYFIYNNYNNINLFNITIEKFKNKEFCALHLATANYAKDFFLIKKLTK